MSFNRENYRKIKQEYEGKSRIAEEKAMAKKEQLHVLVPMTAEIDDELSKTGMMIFEASLTLKGEQLENRICELKEKNLLLQKRREELLAANGLPADFSNVKYECEECSDTGFVGLKMCRCMREKLILAGYESSGIAKLIRQKNFDNFDPFCQKDERASKNMELIYSYCRLYAENFDVSKSPNLLMIGGTGLGKTHLSTAIAGKIVGNGFDVVCETAQNLFADFEYERFGRSYGTGDEEGKKTDKYFECDLLIIDDLGTEMTNQFTVSCLYNILNTRINRGAPMIINTNLTRDELNKRYSDRITSRFFGEFRPMIFMGKDMREQKL